MIQVMMLVNRSISPSGNNGRPLIAMGITGIFTAFLFLFIITGCNSPGKDKGSSTEDTVAHYTLLKPNPLPEAESLRLHMACRQWVDTVLKTRGFNGGILIAKDGNVVFETYCGTGHIPGRDTINAHTPMQIASTTKTFTAMAILLLQQEGKLSIDDEFSKYFPQFNYPGVTIRTLLNHRSGLPNYTYFMENMGWDKTRYVTNADVLDFLVNRKAEFENIAPPGIHFSYCNTNYVLLALLIEKLTGKKYADYLQKVFFTPLQMKDTHVFSMKDSGTALPSYDWKARLMPFGFLDDVYGDKNIYTTVRDLFTWDRFLNSGLVFSPATLEQAYAPYSNEKPGIKNYGLGWRMNILPAGKKIIYHNGWWHGSNCSFIRLLEDKATIIIIGNRFTRAIYHAKILANLFGDYYGLEEEEDLEAVKTADSLYIQDPKKLSLDSGALKIDSGIKKTPLKTRKKRSR